MNLKSDIQVVVRGVLRGMLAALIVAVQHVANGAPTLLLTLP